MSPKQDKHLTATCRCGKVEFEAAGAPIVTGTCYCASCQEAGRRFEQLSPAAPLLDPDGGTGAILWRKDRVRCVKGEDHLVEHRLTPESPTRRVVANLGLRAEARRVIRRRLPIIRDGSPRRSRLKAPRSRSGRLGSRPGWRVPRIRSVTPEPRAGIGGF